jgi:hypothetical protein
MATIQEESNASPLTKVLGEAETDLRNADLDFPWIFGKFFHLICEDFLIPVTVKASEVLSAEAGFIPFSDEVAAFTLGTSFSMIKFGYSLIHHNNVKEDATKLLDNEIADIKSEMHAFKMKSYTPNPLVASLLGVYGFVSNMTLDILTSPLMGNC